MALIHSYGSVAPARRAGEPLLLAAWWFAVVCIGLAITLFSQEFVPAKFTYDSAVLREHLNLRDLWRGISYDGFVNTARVWSLVFSVIPEAVVMPVYYCLMTAGALHFVGAFEVRLARYHLLAGAWILCSALFLSQPSKEMIALPVALYLCLARSWGGRLVATLLFFAYAAFFRQYWAICYFYFACILAAWRLHIAGRSRWAVVFLVVGLVAPFAVAEALGLEPLTDARTMANLYRVDSPDARSAFDNLFENTGTGTDVANAVYAWFYMNVPVALLVAGTPHYVFFAAFQLCTVWFFVAACKGLLKDARRIGRTGTITHLRCAAFVIAYSATQSIFEPDFGSFLRHEIVFMIPMLIVVFLRGHASR
jgi:hypothetical protein